MIKESVIFVFYQTGGLGHIHIPLLSDLNKQISRDYGVLLEGPGIALRWVQELVFIIFSKHHCLKLNSSIRGLFIIDPSGVVKHMSINDLPVGRCVEETLRLVKAFQFVETHGEVCPASWTPESPTVSFYIVEIEALIGWLLIKHALNMCSV